MLASIRIKEKVEADCLNVSMFDEREREREIEREREREFEREGEREG